MIDDLDPIFDACELAYDCEETDTACCMCGNPDASLNEDDELICSDCDYQARHRADELYAAQQSAWAEAFTRAIEARYGTVNEDSIRQYWLSKSELTNSPSGDPEAGGCPDADSFGWAADRRGPAASF